MDILIETFSSAAAAQKRKSQLAGQWDIAIDGTIAAGDDIIFRVWPAGVASPTPPQALDPANKYVVVFTSKPPAAGSKG